MDITLIHVYWDMVNFAFRDIYNIADIFAKATPLILTGLAFGFAFRSTLFNIGAQGQFYMGLCGRGILCVEPQGPAQHDCSSCLSVRQCDSRRSLGITCGFLQKQNLMQMSFSLA